MSLPRWFRVFFQERSKRKKTNSVKTLRVNFERLEDRLAPATLTWVGDVDLNWATNNAGNTNWSGNAVPASGDTLIFDGTGLGKQLNNNTTAGNSYTLQFTAGGYTINGSAMALNNAGDDFTSLIGSNTVAVDLTFAASTTINVSAGSLTLTAPPRGQGEAWRKRVPAR